jgi:hypothetical protein
MADFNSAVSIVFSLTYLSQLAQSVYITFRQDMQPPVFAAGAGSLQQKLAAKDAVYIPFDVR